MKKKIIIIVASVILVIILGIIGIKIWKDNNIKSVTCEITIESDNKTEYIKEKNWFNYKNRLISYKGETTYTYKTKEAYEKAKQLKRYVPQEFDDEKMTEKTIDYRKKVHYFNKGEYITKDMYIKTRESEGYTCK